MKYRWKEAMLLCTEASVQLINSFHDVYLSPVAHGDQIGGLQKYKLKSY